MLTRVTINDVTSDFFFRVRHFSFNGLFLLLTYSGELQIVVNHIVHIFINTLFD